MGEGRKGGDREGILRLRDNNRVCKDWPRWEDEAEWRDHGHGLFTQLKGRVSKQKLYF